MALVLGLVGAFLATVKGRSATVWFILGILAPISLVILLFLPSLNRREARVCPHCSRPIGEHDVVCSHCGRSIPISINMVKCPSCGVLVQEGRICEHCGSAL